MHKDNRIVVNLSSVQWARFLYRNQYGNESDLIPKGPTNRGIPFDPDALWYRANANPCTMLQYARQNNLLDTWVPILRLKLSASTVLEYSGTKAVSIYKEWCSRIFQKKKGTK